MREDDVKFLFNSLRLASIKWSGRKEILKKSRKRVHVRTNKDGRKIYKYYWQCNICKEWQRNQDDMEVDHIVEIGGVSSFKGDWNEVIKKIFPRPVEKHLQCLCVACHTKKTGQYNSAHRKWQRKK